MLWGNNKFGSSDHMKSQFPYKLVKSTHYRIIFSILLWLNFFRVEVHRKYYFFIFIK